MAGLDFCSKHNIYLAKNDGNTDFHQIMDFLNNSLIHFALTISLILSTLFVEQFWTSAKSRTINNISYIDAIVAGKPMTISEASIRSDLLFDDADGIDTLNNQAIFDTIQLMGPSSPNPITNSNPEGSGGNHGVTTQATEIKDLKAQIKQLKKKARPVINHHKAWLRVAMLKKQQKKKVKEKPKKRRSVSKQGRKAVKSSKGAPSVQTNTDWDAFYTDLDKTINEAMDYTFAQDEGKIDSKVEEPETSSKTKEFHLSGDTLVVKEKDSLSIKLTEKEKGVEIRNVEDTERPRPTSTRSILTLRPLPKIDPKDKGKKRIEEEDESDTESEDITEAEKKFKQLANDEEVARKVQEEQDLMLTRYLLKSFKRKREMYTIEQRTKFLHDTIAAQRRFLAQQRSEAIRNKPPSRNQLRNQMMTYLKHVGGKKHSDLKTKSFDEIQVLYEKIKRSDDSFIAIGSAEDEKMIKEMNEQAADASKKRVKKDDSVKGEIKEEEGTRKRRVLQKEEIKNRYHLKKEVMLKLIELKLETEEDSTMDLELIRFVKKQIAELEPKDSDGDEEDP
ncbi:hypothetical protein Tco_1138263 [Tanacetum coccineum]